VFFESPKVRLQQKKYSLGHPMCSRPLNKCVRASRTIGKRLAAARYGVPHLKSWGPGLAVTKGCLADRDDLALIEATDASRRSDPFTITRIPP